MKVKLEKRYVFGGFDGWSYNPPIYGSGQYENLVTNKRGKT
jgi:hypothetical protein